MQDKFSKDISKNKCGIYIYFIYLQNAGCFRGVPLKENVFTRCWPRYKRMILVE